VSVRGGITRFFRDGSAKESGTSSWGAYAISDRWAVDTVEQARRLSLEGVDFFQVREKDLGREELELLVRRVVEVAGPMKVLVNGVERMGADGVHLSRANAEAGMDGLVSVACHSIEEVLQAVALRRSMVLFSPVFGKGDAAGVGVQALREAVVAAGEVPVFALGGVSAENVAACIAAGAAGVAGIRMFL